MKNCINIKFVYFSHEEKKKKLQTRIETQWRESVYRPAGLTCFTKKQTKEKPTAHCRTEKRMLFVCVCGCNGLFIIIATGRWGFKDLIQTYSHLFMLFQKMSLLSDGCAFISAQPRPSSICVSSRAWAFHQRDSICFFSFVWAVFYLSFFSSDGVRKSRVQAMIELSLSTGWSDIAVMGACGGVSGLGLDPVAKSLEEPDAFRSKIVQNASPLKVLIKKLLSVMS